MNDVSQPADLPLPEATPDAAARSDAIDAIVRVLEADRPVPWRVIAADVYDAVADSLRAQGAAAERERIRRELSQRQAVLAYVATSRHVNAVLVRDIEHVLAGDAP